MARILIVEDDHAITDLIAINLQYTGYGYLVISDGGEAAAALLPRIIPLILLYWISCCPASTGLN